MEEKKANKSFEPKSNKLVKIKFKAGRRAAGVNVAADGTAMVEPELAQYLIVSGYAEEVQPSPYLTPNPSPEGEGKTGRGGGE